MVLYNLTSIWIGVTFASIYLCFINAYAIPDPRIEQLDPRGIRISIPDEAGIQLFVFNGNVNRNLAIDQSGSITGEVYQATNGRWIFEDSHVLLRPPDVLNYWLYVQFNGTPQKKHGSWRKSQTPMPGDTCIPSITTTSQLGSVCQGQLLLDDTFDSLNSSTWAREVFIPSQPNYEFCVYHNHESSVKVHDSVLHITPSLLEDSYGEGSTAVGSMTLAQCTSTSPADCSRIAAAYYILPPVISARLTTANRFSFRYGRIEIRAKFPEGDWLYPELWLQPINPNQDKFINARVQLGMARGNRKLTDHTHSFDSRLIEFGVCAGSTLNYHESTVQKLSNETAWTTDYHIYSTTWKPGGFEFHVDGIEVGRLNSDSRGWFNTDEHFTDSQNTLAPFDTEFYLTLGIGVGGVRNFPDNTFSGIDHEYAKPWRNVAAKAMLRFWQAKHQWLPSWQIGTSDNANLKIDYVRVWAL